MRIDPTHPSNRQVGYTAGPITANVAGTTEEFVETARKIAVEMRKRGWSILCPHTNSIAIEGWTLADYLREDFELLARCDFLVLLPHWQESRGAKAEVEFASRHGIPVLDYRAFLPDWEA
jgi:hypothetical protein